MSPICKCIVAGCCWKSETPALYAVFNSECFSPFSIHAKDSILILRDNRPSVCGKPFLSLVNLPWPGGGKEGPPAQGHRGPCRPGSHLWALPHHRSFGSGLIQILFAFNTDRESSCRKKEFHYHGSSLRLLSGFSKCCVGWELVSGGGGWKFLGFYATRSHVHTASPSKHTCSYSILHFSLPGFELSWFDFSFLLGSEQDWVQCFEATAWCYLWCDHIYSSCSLGILVF